jgi:hypothetical protein
VETKKGLFIGRGFEGLIPTLPPWKTRTIKVEILVDL